MIFQINYQTDKYDQFFEVNKPLIPYLDGYEVFDTNGVDYFLRHYGYYDMFYSLNSDRVVFLCDALRVLILYELGGVYIDADTVFMPQINQFEDDLKLVFNDRNLLTMSRSMYFIKGVKKSKFMEKLKEIYFTRGRLIYDIHMLSVVRISEFPDTLAFVDNKRLDKYFLHSKITT